MADRTRTHEPFQEAPQQHEADMLGMYIFLASEIMLFGGIFAVAAAYRILHPQDVVEASKRLHVWIGALNTAVLLTSSLAVALAVHAARACKAGRAAALLACAGTLGLAFLCIKFVEYGKELSEGLLPGLSAPARFASPVHHLFMNLYLFATGLHAIHVTIGIVLLGTVALRVARGALRLPDRAVVVETAGLYWHLVDVIWVFLYPVLYLAR